MVITEHGRAAAVLLDIATYEALTKRGEILKGLEEGERAFAEGRTATWDEVKADLAKWRGPGNRDRTPPEPPTQLRHSRRAPYEDPRLVNS